MYTAGEVSPLSPVGLFLLVSKGWLCQFSPSLLTQTNFLRSRTEISSEGQPQNYTPQVHPINNQQVLGDRN